MNVDQVVKDGVRVDDVQLVHWISKGFLGKTAVRAAREISRIALLLDLSFPLIPPWPALGTATTGSCETLASEGLV